MEPKYMQLFTSKHYYQVYFIVHFQVPLGP